MSEVKYESKITSSTASANQIYHVLSNLNNLKRVQHLIPADKVKDIQIEEEQIAFTVEYMGQNFTITIRIAGKEENNYVKYAVANLPGVEPHLWVQMKEVKPGDTRLKLTLKSDMPMMYKLFLKKAEPKLQEGIDQAATMLAQMPFQQWDNIV